MAIYHQDIADIELNSGSILRTFLKRSIGLADAAANRFGVRVFRDGEPETLSGVTCQGFFKNADGVNIALTSYGTIDGNVAYVTLPAACYNVEGRFTLAIKLVGSDVTGTMRIVDGNVDNTNTSSAVAPTGSVPTYQEVLSVFEQMQDTLEDYNETVATQNAQIDNLKSALGKTKEVYKGLIQGNNTWSDNAARNCMIVPCEPNDRIEITSNGNQTFYAFLQSFTPPIVANTTPDFCSGYTARIQLSANTSISRYAPPDCHYVYVMTNSGSDCTPAKMTVSGYDIFGELINQTDDIIKALTESQWASGYINTNASVGSVVNLNGVIAANYNYKIIRCAPGDHIYIAGLGGGNARLWAFLDASCKLISKSDDSASTAGTIMVAPASSAFCVINASGDVEARAINVDDPIFNNDRICTTYKNIAEMQELFSPDSVYAYVASDRSDFGKGYRGNHFEYKKTATYEDIELDDGSFAKLVMPPFAPLKSNYECIDKMLEIAYSYSGTKTAFPTGIPYVSLSGPFRNDGNVYGIQCSQFVNAVLQGLTYENSKLSGKISNTFLSGGCRWISTSPWVTSDEGAMSANQLAHFAAAHGWLNQTQYFKDCEVGDVVFIAINTPNFLPYDWNGIVHCAIVVAKNGHETVCIGAGSMLEPNEANPLLDASRQWYPNGTNDQAVTCQVIKNDETPFWYNNRGLFGFARFPVTFHDLSETEQEIISHL